MNTIIKILLKLIPTNCTQVKDYLNNKYHLSILKKLKKENQIILQNIQHLNLEIQHKEKIIWVMWLQGLDSAPEIVTFSINSIRKFSEKYNYKMVILTDDNIKDYIILSNNILKKYSSGIIDRIKYSDIVRLAILSKYGGTWLDATMFISKDSVDYFSSNIFYTIKTSERDSSYVSNGYWTGFCISVPKNYPLIVLTRDLILNYFENHDYVIDYFLIDYLFKISIECLDYKDIIEELSISNENLYYLGNHINEIYNYKDWQKVTENTGLFKLSYKTEINIDVKGSYYNKIKSEVL